MNLLVNLDNVKFCHYFNNGKKCPYEDIGCMFNHKVSDTCRYNQFYRNRLCQFRHDNEQNKHSEDENDLDKESNNDSDCEAESESEAIECDLCGSLFEKEYELTEHQETGNCGYLCEPCGVSFLKKSDLAIHERKHCTKCCDEFDINILEEHKLTCEGMDFNY